MKKFIAMTLCIILAACVLVGCGRKRNQQTTDTTTTPTTLTTHATNNTTPSTEGTVPSSSFMSQDEGDTTSHPSSSNDNMDGNSDIGRSRSHSQFPHMNGVHR